MNRLRNYWSGRPYHKITLYSEEGDRISLRFRNAEWSRLLVKMGNMGATDIDDAVAGAVSDTLGRCARSMSPVLDDHPEKPTGMYL